LRNPYWQYSRDKIACEDLLVEAYREWGFPTTIVRPSHTYDRRAVPLTAGWTAVARMRQHKPVVVHGDGTSLWVLTHHTDFARAFVALLGHPQAIGETFHITSDEVLTWDQIYRILGRAAGAEPQLVHVSSETIAKAAPHWGPPLLGDMAHSVVFDNTNIRRIAPGWVATTPFAQGAEEIIAWHDADPARQVVDQKTDELLDWLVASV
jgi:nucleoside-diphosphate-sugar epimerase